MDYILDEARNYLSTVETFRHDPTQDGYRSSEELAEIEARVKEKAERMSEDFTDELEVKGISTPQDYIERTQIIADILQIYRNRFLKWLSRLWVG